ncbi:MAG: hypothetical protein L3J59_09055 [Methylococcaceae bacterium]|nr:hypothetical protein [Methylococcaceae bacterium]
MKLTDKNGFSVTFEVSGYEFPQEEDSYDSNWLNITTFVTHPMGTWKTIDPSMLTDELEDLRDFFTDIIDKPDTSKDLFFLEPNLHFKYTGLETEKTLKVCFYLESKTHWFKKNEDVDMKNLSLSIPFDSNEFKQASESIAKYCIDFPRRPESYSGIKDMVTIIVD